MRQYLDLPFGVVSYMAGWEINYERLEISKLAMEVDDWKTIYKRVEFH